MPSSVVVLIHAAHIGASVDMVAEWAGQPMTIEDPLKEMVGERIAKLVDLDAAGDMVITAQDRGGKKDPDVRLAVSLAVKDFEGTKSALQTDYGIVPLANGAFEITRSGEHRHEGDAEFRSCALAPSEGEARIVCSKDATLRDAMLPYLTRGLGALKNIKNDVHVEARPGPFREMVKRERASITQAGSHFFGGNQSMQGIWEAALGDLADSFLDVDRATADGTLDAKLGTVEFKVIARGTHGAITRVLSGHPEKAEPAPAIFLKLPGDSDVAWFGHGLDPSELVTPKTALVTGIGAALNDEPGFNDADKKAFRDVVEHTVDVFAAPIIVYARGVDISKALPATSGLTDSSDAAKIKIGFEQAAGWDILGADLAGSSMGPDKVVALVKEWTSVLSRPPVTKAMSGGNLPITWKVVPAHNAPPGTVHVALTVSHEDVDWTSASSGNKPKKRPPFVVTLHTLVVPDQTRVWVVNALDEATAAAKARGLVSAGTPTLATREGLDALKTMRTNAGGFTTPRGVGMGLPVTWLFADNVRYKATTDPIMGVSSQTQYTTPLVFTAAESVESGNEHSLTFGLRVPRGAVQDVMQVGPHIFR
jgi:hypothetical protein